jgi:plastocyanin
MLTRSVLIAIVLLGAAACTSDDSPAAPPACDAPAETTTVTMGEFFYEPTCVQASNGTTLEIVNDGDAPHTFTLNDGKLQSNLEPHESGELAIDGLTPGTVYLVTCIYHSNMTSALKAV